MNRKQFQKFAQDVTFDGADSDCIIRVHFTCKGIRFHAQFDPWNTGLYEFGLDAGEAEKFFFCR